MTRSWWPRAGAAAFLVCTSVANADAQTFIVRSVPAGNDVEVVFGTAVGKGTANAQGDATVVLTGSPAATQESAAAINTDICGTTIRVLLSSRTTDPPAAGPGCQRRIVPGYFVFRPETSVVIDTAPNIPIVRIRQGRVPDSWLRQGPIPIGRTAPRGLIVFGGGGFAGMEDTLLQLCGNTSPCNRETTKLNFGGGAAYWLTTWLGVEGMYLKPLAFRAEGTGDNYEMAAKADPRFVTAAAIGGWALGPARFYGRLGAAYHRAVVETTQATFAAVISQDGVTTTYPSSTQVFTYDTVGWGLIYGFGVEGWASDSAAVYADVSFIDVEGKNADQAGERIMKDKLSASRFTSVTAGDPVPYSGTGSTPMARSSTSKISVEYGGIGPARSEP
jgi:hypothetical protein